jgi:hypothetical protein
MQLPNHRVDHDDVEYHYDPGDLPIDIGPGEFNVVVTDITYDNDTRKLHIHLRGVLRDPPSNRREQRSWDVV